MGLALAIALAAFVIAHLWLVGALAVSAHAARSRRAWLRALGALVVLPLAPWWGWQIGQKATALAWLTALGAYAGLTFALLSS